jgi:Heparinase II/III-like protein/Heparinase II/III N-terminus
MRRQTVDIGLRNQYLSTISPSWRKPGHSSMYKKRGWSNYMAKISGMSADEIVVRFRQALGKRLEAARSSFGLRFEGGDYASTDPGAARFFFEEAELAAILSELKRRLPLQAEAIFERADRICAHNFDLLGYQGLQVGEEIDWQFDFVHRKRAPRKPWFRIHYLDFEEVGDSKIIWELNRHQHLVTLAKAYRISGEENYSRELFDQWYDWQQQNPYPIGINWASSLEVAFRTMAWLWVWHLMAGTAVLPRGFRGDLLKALAISGRHIERYLSTYFSPNTHLLGEGVGLFFIGSLCPEIPAADRWRRRGWEIVLAQAQQQVLPDGMHFEQSTYYHVYALDFFLHAYLLGRRNQQAIPEFLPDTIERMLEALASLAQAGPPPRFGDDDGGRLFDPRRNRAEHLTDPLATGAVLYHRADFKLGHGELPEESLWLLGRQAAERYDALPLRPTVPFSRALAASGHYIMADENPIAQLTVDAGPQGVSSAGHGHADALSVQLSIAGMEFVTDGGTFEYVGDGSERDRLRCTGSHSTLQVDGSSQALPEGPFAWRGLPTVLAERWIMGPNFDLFVGSHDGYSRLPSAVRHRRSIFHLKSRFWLVRDLALGEGSHELDQVWRLASQEVNAGRHSFGLSIGDRALTIVVCAEPGIHPSISQDLWSPAYGAFEMRPTLHLHKRQALPADIVTLLVPVAQADAGELERVTEASRVQAYRYRCGAQEHWFAFPGEPGPWSLHSWSTDAEFLYLAVDATGTTGQAIAVNCSHLERNHRVLISRRQPLEWIECHRDGQLTNILTSGGVVAGSSGPEMAGHRGTPVAPGRVRS